MAQASFSLRAAASARTASQAIPKRPGLFKFLLAMLHHSRRLQAERILRQHAHLFERSGEELDLTKLRDR